MVLKDRDCFVELEVLEFSCSKRIILLFDFVLLDLGTKELKIILAEFGIG